MHVEFVIALIIVIAVVLFPAAFLWYMNISGIYAAVRDRIKKAAKEKVR